MKGLRLNGTVDEPMIFDRALTTAELEAFYGRQYHQRSVGHWPFDESEGCIASDASGNDYDAALWGATKTAIKKLLPRYRQKVCD